MLGLCSLCFSCNLFIQCGLLGPAMVPPTLRVYLPISVNLSADVLTGTPRGVPPR